MKGLERAARPLHMLNIKKATAYEGSPFLLTISCVAMCSRSPAAAGGLQCQIKDAV